MIQTENPVSRASHAFDDYRRAILLHLAPAARAEYPLRFQGRGNPTFRMSGALPTISFRHFICPASAPSGCYARSLPTLALVVRSFMSLPFRRNDKRLRTATTIEKTHSMTKTTL